MAKMVKVQSLTISRDRGTKLKVPEYHNAIPDRKKHNAVLNFIDAMPGIIDLKASKPANQPIITSKEAIMMSALQIIKSR